MTDNTDDKVSKKYNNRIQAMRDRLGKTDDPVEPQEQNTEGTEKQSSDGRLTSTVVAYMQRFYGRLLIENEPTTAKVIAERTGIPEGMVKKVTKPLEDMNLVKYEVLKQRGGPKVYSINTETPLPEGWPSAEELKYSIPLVNVPKEADLSEEGKLASARDNPLTKMLLNDGKSVFDTSGYEQFINDTKASAYPPELEAVVEVLHQIYKARIMNKRIDCPICNRKMERTNSELYCKKCNKRIDGGSLEMSLELFRIIARSEGVKAQ